MGRTPYVSKPLTSGAEADGRFCKLDFAHAAENDVYRCSAGDKLAQCYTAMEHTIFKNTESKFKLLYCRLRADLAWPALLLFHGLMETKTKRFPEPRGTEIRFRRGAKLARLSRTAPPKTGENLDLA